MATVLSLTDEQRDLARGRIVRAARRVLSERGLATTADEVAEAAGVSRRTVFRYFATLDALFASAIRDGLRSYAQQLPEGPTSAGPGELEAWLDDLLLTVHRLNARNGRIYWELAAFEPELSGELADVAAERRASRKRFASIVTQRLWKLRGRDGRPPRWLVDIVAVHLSGFTTQSLGGDFGRSPEDVARVSSLAVLAALDAAASGPLAPA